MSSKIYKIFHQERIFILITLIKEDETSNGKVKELPRKTTENFSSEIGLVHVKYHKKKKIP